jgi:hypothetical protein
MDERTRRAYPTDRRGASVKRDSDVTASRWPVTTLAAYQNMLNAASNPKPEGEINERMIRLCQGRIAIAHAVLATRIACTHWKEGKVRQQLLKVLEELEGCRKSYPLDIRKPTTT